MLGAKPPSSPTLQAESRTFYRLSTPWLELRHSALTPARTPRLHYKFVIDCIVLSAPSSAMITPCIIASHSSEMEINPLKMVKKDKKNMAHTVLSPHGRHLSRYNFKH